MSLTDLSAREIAAAVRDRRLSAVDVLAAFRDRIGHWNDRLGAFARVEGESADRAAREVDRRVARGEDPGPLAGVPLAGRADLAATGPALDAGAVLVGDTHLDEFVRGDPGRNPWDLERVAVGSAIAVAARLAPLALGSGPGESVLRSAAFCGVVALASALDPVAPVARTVREAAVLLRAISGEGVPPDVPAEGPIRLDGVRLGLPVDLAPVEVEVREHFEAGLDSFRGLGAEIVSVTLLQGARGALEAVEAILTPTAPEVAFRLGGRSDPADVLDVTACAAGLLAVSVPGGVTDHGLPVGMRIVGGPEPDARVLTIAAAFEDVTGFHRLVPEAVR